MIKLKFLLALLGNWFGVLARRLAMPPMRPGWGIKYETLVRTFRTIGARAHALGAGQGKNDLDAMVLPVLSRPRGPVTTTQVITGGVSATWVAPKGVVMGLTRPSLVYFHGGGFQSGSFDRYEHVLARLALAANMRVLAVDYRLTPDYPYPAALEDALGVVRWLRENNLKDVVFAGDDAGGHLAIAAMLRLREVGEALPLRCALASPWVDIGSSGIAKNYAFDTVPEGGPATWRASYMPQGRVEQPQLSLLETDLRGLPPMLLQVGDLDVFHDDVLALAKKARAEGTNVTATVYKEMVHDWQLFSAWGIPDAVRAVDEMGTFLAQAVQALPAAAAAPEASRAAKA